MHRVAVHGAARRLRRHLMIAASLSPPPGGGGPRPSRRPASVQPASLPLLLAVVVQAGRAGQASQAPLAQSQESLPVLGARIGSGITKDSHSLSPWLQMAVCSAVVSLFNNFP